jgi:HK97 family phage major capsid protein
MATMVEEARHKLQAVAKEHDEFVAKVLSDCESERRGPTEDEERHQMAMENGMADLRAEITRFEHFGAVSRSDGNREERHNPTLDRNEGRAAAVSAGQRFLASDAYRAAIANYAPDGRISEKFSTPKVMFKGLNDLSAALVTGGSATSAGAFIVADQSGIVVPLGRRPLRIRDVITVRGTNSDLVEYVALTSRTNNANIVAEATSVNDGAKPESDLAAVRRNAPVVTIANWMPVTKQAVADEPQMRSIIDNELRDNVLEEEEDQVVNGTGDLVGITQTSNTQTQAWDTNILTTTRKAKTIVSTVGRVFPTAYLLNPQEWEIIDLLQDNEARYYYGGPAQTGVARLWGLPVVETEAVVAGTGIVGDLRKCVLWDREQVSISITDSHADFFIRNLLAILAEERIAFALTQPNAIVEMDLTA